MRSGGVDCSDAGKRATERPVGHDELLQPRSGRRRDCLCAAVAPPALLTPLLSFIVGRRLNTTHAGPVKKERTLRDG